MKYTKKTAFEAADAFGIGAPNDTYAQYFIGQSFLKPLTEPEKAPVFLFFRGKHCIKLVRKMRRQIFRQIACKAVRRALCGVA